MGFLDDILNGGIDRDFDGDIDSRDRDIYFLDEELRVQKEERDAEIYRQQSDDWRDYHFNDFATYGLNPDDYDDEEEYLEALEVFKGEEDDDNLEIEDDNDSSTSSTIATISFSLAEPKRTASTAGVWKYYDESWDLWDFAQAMIDEFPELAEDYESGSDLTLPNIITETFEIDRPRAIKYLKWLWSTFTPEFFKDEKEGPWHRHSYKCRGALIYRLLIENDDDYGLYKLLKNDETFIRAAFYEGIADKHDYELAKEYIGLMLSKNDFEAAETMYNHYLKGHQGRYSDNDLGKLWQDLIDTISWSNLSRPKKIKLATQVIPILGSLGVRGKKPKRKIDDHLKEWSRKD